MNVVFAGGGSGGHLFPGVAVAEELADREPACRPVFVGSNREIEKQILAACGFDHIALAASPSSAFLKRPLSSVINNLRAYRAAGRVFDEIGPSAVVGLGGFASVPVVLAARRRKIPIVLMEQNAVLGRANHWLLPLANQVCLSYPETPLSKRYGKIARLTGNPVRRTIIQAAAEKADRESDLKTMLILGGSQGAVAVNDAVAMALPDLRAELSGWRILHQTGNRQENEVQKAYADLGVAGEVSAFFTEMGAIYRHADLVVARAGGTTLAELGIHGLPAVLIPYPGSIRDHQQKNAEHYAKAGGAIVLSQSVAEQTARELARCLKLLLTDPEQRETMRTGMNSLARPQAADEVAEAILRSFSAHRTISVGSLGENQARQTKSA